MKYSTSELFERHFCPDRFEPRASGRVARSPRIARNDSELKKIYQRYIRMGFDAREARFKALTYHSMKL